MSVALALAACGRVGFDARSDAGGDTSLPPGASINLELPAGGQMRELAVSPTDGAWYVLSYFGGSFVSLDSGGTWSRCAPLRSDGIEVAPDGTVWSAGPETYASTDHCATWTAMNAPAATLDVGFYGAEVWAVGLGGIWLRTGNTWTQHTTPIDGDTFARFGGNASTARIVGSWGGGIVVSTDGMTWVQRPTQSNRVNDIQAVGTTLYVYTGADGVSTGGVDCSSGNGTTWTPCDPDGGTALAADPLDPQHVVFAIYDDLAETFDAFGQVNKGMREPAGIKDDGVNELVYTPTGTLIAATERGVFASPPGPLALQPKLTGLSAWTIDAILVEGTDVFLSTGAGPLRSQNQQPFTMWLDGIRYATRATDLAFAPDGTLIATGRMIWMSHDRGQTWEVAHPLDIPDAYNARTVAFVGTRALVGTQTRLLYSDPPYTTWSFTALPTSSEVNDIAVIGTTVFVAADAGLFVSTDQGQSLQQEPAVGTNTQSIGTLSDGSLLVVSQNELWRSSPGRSAWTAEITTNVDKVVVDNDRMVAINSFAPSVRYYDAAAGAWQLLPTAPGVYIATAAFDTDGSLVLGTYGHGLVRVSFPY